MENNLISSLCWISSGYARSTPLELEISENDIK